MREALDDKLRTMDSEPSVFDLMNTSVGSIGSGIRDLGHNPIRMKGLGSK
jgi:hypothetical protein